MLSEPKYQNFSLDKVLKKYPVIRLTGGTADKLNAETHNRYRKALEERTTILVNVWAFSHLFSRSLLSRSNCRTRHLITFWFITKRRKSFTSFTLLRVRSF